MVVKQQCRKHGKQSKKGCKTKDVLKKPATQDSQQRKSSRRGEDAAFVPIVAPGGCFRCVPAGTSPVTISKLAHHRGTQGSVCAGPLIRLLKNPPLGPWQPLEEPKSWPKLPDWKLLRAHRGPDGPAPPLKDDALFWGNGDPCVLPFLPPASKVKGRGSVVVCPGGNYVFLQPCEGAPVARYFAENLGVPAFVVKYRLLPNFGLDEAIVDLQSAVKEARRHAPRGPVVVIGFSAGGHLVASANARRRGWHGQRPDAQVLVYPAIYGHDWLDEKKAGFGTNVSLDTAKVRSLVKEQARITPGPEFIPPPPTFLVSSTTDAECSPSKHSDAYARAIMAANVPLVQMRDDFGGHGFSLQNFWARPCLQWLHSRNVGQKPDYYEAWSQP